MKSKISKDIYRCWLAPYLFLVSLCVNIKSIVPLIGQNPQWISVSNSPTTGEGSWRKRLWTPSLWQPAGRSFLNYFTYRFISFLEVGHDCRGSTISIHALCFLHERNILLPHINVIVNCILHLYQINKNEHNSTHILQMMENIIK